MRITISLEKDVAARLQRLKKTRPFNALVNDALRAGLDEIERGLANQEKRYAIKPVKGEPFRTDLDNIAEVIAEIEGEDHK
jgi:metal-responsive CopG/Arc/MetJ family transcriptional regulator